MKSLLNILLMLTAYACDAIATDEPNVALFSEMQTKIDSLENRLEKETQKTRTLVHELKSEISKTNTLEMKLELEASKTQALTEKVDALLRSDCFQKGSLPRTERHDANATTNIAFSAYLTHDLKNLGPEHTIQFGGVTLNDGDAYNAFTGIFTVPMDGVYFITATLDTTTNYLQWFNIVVNGKIISTISLIPTAIGQHLMGSNVVIIRLRRGQSVWVAVDPNISGESLYGQVHGTTFSAFYLYP